MLPVMRGKRSKHGGVIARARRYLQRLKMTGPVKDGGARGGVGDAELPLLR